MCKILLVDDDNKLRPHLVSVLDAAGYNVIPCSTVSEARSLYKEHGIELAILDDELPNGHGINLARHIGRDNVPVIMMGNPTGDERHAALLCGVTMFLNKPFDEEDLVTMADRAVKSNGGALPYSLYGGGGGRQIGDEVSMQTLYAKVSTMSSRQREITSDVALFKDQMAEIKPTLENLMERTGKCAFRGERLAVLEEKVSRSGVNWDRLIGIALALIQAGLAAYIARVVTNLP